ncbi:hypothetical protein [Solidesulfovibrio carbinolicus]|uniref:Uncharacterized protein n=1 Tax=Solidesulfovibrio carbinolicus TaxID=296842 RepID=A0A4P6HTP6_9BACT|nr:hypothetical protein [Solidesulfovibrio carbinolicus]QAZ68828.1 hypothetical protein C3Y92_16940 [Solidesulfovibrio carbinolicus]
MPAATPAAVDILDALLRADTDTPYPGEQDLARLIRRAAAPLPRTPAAPTPPPLAAVPAQPKPAAPRPRKRKATHYLAPKLADRLDAATHELATLAGQDGQAPRRIAKSAVVEAALALALADFEAHAAASPLAGRLLQRT